MGEVGAFPPSVTCHINALNYYHDYARLQFMNDKQVAHQVYQQLCVLQDLGFETWIGRVRELARTFRIDTCVLYDCTNIDQCRKIINTKVRETFTSNWTDELHNVQKNPLLRTYNLFKNDFHIEPYLNLIDNNKYRFAVAQLRASSHNLEVQRGRQTKPITPLESRLCHKCNVVDDEQHFVTKCLLNNDERVKFYTDIYSLHSSFSNLNDNEKFIFLMKCNDSYILNQFGKFVYISFQKRKSLML